MKTLTKILGIGALTLALAGCGGQQQTIQNLSGEYGAKPNMTQKAETFAQLEGTIVKVQPSQVSYSQPAGFATTSGNHEFEYVMVRGKDGKLITLIYPYSKAILETDATLRYRPLASGKMDSETFVQTFLQSSFDGEDNFVIEADGIITGNGIQYSGGK